MGKVGLSGPERATRSGEVVSTTAGAPRLPANDPAFGYATGLSKAFRNAADSVLPSVVTVREQPKEYGLARHKPSDNATQHTERNRSMADRIGLGLLVLGACGAVGGLMAGFGIARSIANRIEQSEREATRSEQLAAIGQLAAGLAHELRNPLTAMRVLVEAGRDQARGSGLDRRDLEVLDEEIARLDKLVEPFVSSKETGMGLGLAVSRRIVEAHGGTISVLDNPGDGARFTIWLPHCANRSASQRTFQAQDS